MDRQDGSDQAQRIRTAVAKHERSLLRYAWQIVGDAERARDVVQDTFLKLCQQDTAGLDGHLTEWLYTVCRNRAIDICRKESRMKTMTPENASSQPTRGQDHVQKTEQQDSFQQVQRLLANLTENQQEVVRLKFQCGLSYKEISRVTQLSASNVGYLIHTAVQKLRTQLEA